MTVDEQGAVPVPALAGYHHVPPTVTDIDASEAWYRKVFGLQRAMVEQHQDGEGHAADTSHHKEG